MEGRFFESLPFSTGGQAQAEFLAERVPELDAAIK